MQRTIKSQALDSLNVGSFGLQNRNQAAVHKLAIQADGARAALAFAASFLGSSQM
jgi:Holliday junction resolvasome RuvABC ATP-dependent DNA helicase subunit